MAKILWEKLVNIWLDLHTAWVDKKLRFIRPWNNGRERENLMLSVLIGMSPSNTSLTLGLRDSWGRYIIVIRDYDGNQGNSLVSTVVLVHIWTHKGATWTVPTWVWAWWAPSTGGRNRHKHSSLTWKLPPIYNDSQMKN